MESNTHHPYARRLTQDLFDALWLEDLYGFRKHCVFDPAADGETVLKVVLDKTRSLHWRGRRADGLRPFRVSDRPVVLPGATHTTDLNAVQTVEALQSADWWLDRSGRFARFFRLAYVQAAFSAEREHSIVAKLTAAPDDLLSWEALSCLKDRPFHPLARAKDWDGSDGTAYSPETRPSFPLHWVALLRDRIRGSAIAGQPLAECLLDPMERDTLSAAASAHGADGDAWLWLPIHPWQWARFDWTGLSATAAYIDLGTGPGSAIPTASLRSLTVTGCSDIHLKVSLSINALGAIRTLPPRYLHNAVLAGACLESLRRKDAWLASNLRLCDESQWWALRQCDTLEADPGELACLIRQYPALPGTRLVPMAALPVTIADGALPAFDHLLGYAAHEEEAWMLFADIARALLELGLRCFAQGVMPELHGQNVLLAFQGQHIAALVLRDHDTLRVCRPLMQAQGVAAPAYVIDRSTPNTLELDNPRELLAYLQTLAIEVNLYAILAALAERYDREEAHGWHLVRTALEACLACVSLPDEIASQTRTLLLDEAAWPFKQVLAPLLGRPSFGTGMPSAMGRLINPLLAVEGTV